MNDMPQDSPVLAAALRYAAAGVAVFPARLGVRGDGKKDVRPIADWDLSSSTDPVVIRGWFENGWAGAALCIDCGKSGIVGVDQDVHDGKTGPANWAALGQGSAIRVKSPTGGLHDYYRADPEHPFTVDNTGAVAEGVDIRGMGGFLFAPPTIDPRGGAWEWDEREPASWDLPPVPGVVVERMALAQANKRKKARERPVPAAAVPGVVVSGSDQSSETSSLLFGGGGAETRDFGPDGGWKSTGAAVELLRRETEAFAALTEVNSSRSHILAQKLGVLAGHGVPGFWSYEVALGILIEACERNGFIDEHGESYAVEQAGRGLQYGMLQPWHRIPEQGSSVEFQAVPSTGIDANVDEAVERMMAKLLDRDQLDALPEPVPLVEDLLDLDSETWIIGASGGFKSFVALDIACHVGRGQSWRGRQVTQGEVVYIVAEGAKGIRQRVRAWEKVYGGQMQGVRVLPEPVLVAPKGFAGGIGPDWRTLVEVVRRIRPALVIVDTQARVTVGLKENDNSEMGLFIRAVGELKRAAGSCVLVVHHTGRDGGDARGASAIDGAQDTELKVTRPGGRARADLTAEIRMDKQKDGADDVTIPVQLKVVEVGRRASTGAPITSLAIEPWTGFESALFKPEKVPTWRLVLDGVKAEVMQVMQDHAGSMGATSAEIITWIKERRAEAGDERPVAKNTISAAIKSLCGEQTLADGTDSFKALERLSISRVGVYEE